MVQAQFHPLRIAQVVAETDEASSLVFELPEGLRDTFAYRPGQFLTLKVPLEGAAQQRCYSLSSSPQVDNALRVTIKRVRGGRVSNWICDRLGAGDTVDVMPPAGVFTPRSLDGDLLLFAGGSGITPVLSIAKAALRHGGGNVTLIYANRDERSVIFRDALRDLAARHAHTLRVIHWLDSVQGAPSQAQLEALASPWGHADCFICGPGPFMDGAQAALQALGVARERIHVERFGAPPPAAGQAEEVAPPVSAAAALEVELDGVRHRLDAQAGETVLDAMLRAGIAAPNSCRSGLCGACMCQVTHGAATLGENHVLDTADRQAGWTLACQARAAGSELHLKFPD